MKQLFLHQGSLVHKEFSLPLQSEHALLVKVAYSCISSGTESATLTQAQTSLIKKLLLRAPHYSAKVMSSLRENGFQGTVALARGVNSHHLALGYSCSGQVIAVGEKVRGFSVGDYVACGGAGFASHSEYVAVPSMLAVRLSSSNFLKEASLTTIGSIALQGVRQARVQLGDTVCIIGLGLLGMITVQLLKNAGCRVIGIDINERRLEEAKRWCELTLHGNDANICDTIQFFTNHHGVDATIITASASSGEILQQAATYTRRKGSLVLVGDVKIDFDRSPFYEKELTLYSSCSYGPGRYDRSYEHEGVDYPYAYVRWTEQRNMNYIAAMLEKKELDVSHLLACQFDFEEANNAYTYLQVKKPLAVILSYQNQNIENEEKVSEHKTSFSYTPFFAKPFFNVAVIGCGGFSKVKLIPLLNSHAATTLYACADSDPAAALSCAEQYAVSLSARSHLDLLEDEKIDMAVIATPHALHTRQALDFLRRGKAVFCEKPAVVTWEEYHELKKFLVDHPDAMFTIDFNRSYAPYIVKIKTALQNRSTPLMISYRMNAGFIPQSHWVQAAEQGGRIVGEGCHIIDLFLFLIGSKPLTISAEPIHTSRDDITGADNCIITIRFEDGSITSLFYTSLGNRGCSKEYLELFCEGKTIIMNDYTSLVGYGYDASFSLQQKSADKGHQALMDQFIKSAQGRAVLPISYERILLTTELSLIIHDLLSAGGGSCNYGMSEEKILE